MKRGALLIIILLIIPLATAGLLNKITAKATECPETYEPVCGINGKTYDNACKAKIRISHKGVCDKNEFVLLYKDPDTNVIKFWNTFSPEIQEKVFNLDYLNTRDENFIVNTDKLENDIFSLRINLKADEGYPGTGKDFIKLYWNVSSKIVNHLGSSEYNINISDLEIEAVMGEKGEEKLEKVNHFNKSLRTRYGAIIERPDLGTINDSIHLKVPADLVKAILSFSDKDNNRTLFKELRMGDSIEATYTHKEFNNLKDSNFKFDNTSYNFYEMVAIKEGPIPTTNLMSKDLRFNEDIYLKLKPDNLIYKYIFVHPFNFNQINITQGLTLNILGKNLIIYVADQITGKLILEYNSNVKPYYDKDPFVDEVSEEPDWRWDIGVMPKMQLGVENEKAYQFYEDNPVTENECYEFPFEYFSVCLNNFTVKDSEYLDLKFKLAKHNDFSKVYPLWDNISAIKISTHGPKSIKLSAEGITIGANEIYIFPTAQREMKEEEIQEIIKEQEKKQEAIVVKEKKTFDMFKDIDLIKKYLIWALAALGIIAIVDLIYKLIKNRNT